MRQETIMQKSVSETCSFSSITSFRFQLIVLNAVRSAISETAKLLVVQLTLLGVTPA